MERDDVGDEFAILLVDLDLGRLGQQRLGGGGILALRLDEEGKAVADTLGGGIDGQFARGDRFLLGTDLRIFLGLTLGDQDLELGDLGASPDESTFDRAGTGLCREAGRQRSDGGRGLGRRQRGAQRRREARAGYEPGYAIASGTSSHFNLFLRVMPPRWVPSYVRWA